jgi:hypothetical protein
MASTMTMSPLRHGKRNRQHGEKENYQNPHAFLRGKELDQHHSAFPDGAWKSLVRGQQFR